MADEFIYKGQEISYLGFLETQLRDMQGIATLAYELIQNADDVRAPDGQPGSSRISFDVRADALVVENDGVFRAVDFERLQMIAGGGKRAEAGTTGAFGLGFLAVYQVTDAPEIFSGGRHWTIRPDAAPAQRIRERVVETTGTRLQLPWALDPDSAVRRILRLPVVRKAALDELAQELSQAVELAALFLQQLQLLEVKREGQLVRRVERVETGEAPTRHLELRDETGERATWLLLEGALDVSALGPRYPEQIEAGRSDRVQLALPLDRVAHQGRLFAGLPTATQTPLPFHVNADFYPTSDRKRLHFDGGYQAAWNEAALQAAADLLADRLETIRRHLEPATFWHLLQQSNYAHKLSSRGELPSIFSSFWQALLPLFRELPLLYTIQETWLLPAEGRVPDRAPDQSARDLLAAFQIPLIHPALAPYAELMRTPEVGVPLLTEKDVVAALIRAGVTGSVPLHEAPSFLASVEKLQGLWRLLTQLTEPFPPPEVRARAQELFNRVAIVLAERMTLERPQRVFRGNADVRALFPDVPWAHPLVPERQLPGWLIDDFGVRQAVAWLAEKPYEQLEEAWRLGRLDLPALFRWFESQQIEIFADNPALKKEIRRLPLCPVDGELRPLTELYIPGGFEDPLGVAGTVPLAAIGGRRQFLEDLGVEALRFDRYVHRELPRALAQDARLPSDRRHRLLDLLAERLGELRDDEALREQLSRLPLIPCLDGSFRPGREVYTTRAASTLLGEGTHVAEPAPTRAREALYHWLGVRETPAAPDLVRRLVRLSEQESGAGRAPAETAAVAEACWQRLQRYHETGDLDPVILAPLRGKQVIPAGLQRLARPEEMFLVDSAPIADRFPELEARWLSPAAEVAPVWQLAGVRPLSTAVSIEVATPQGTEAAPALQKQIAGRLPLIRRVARAEGGAAESALALLEHLRVVTAAPLQLQYHLALGDESVRSRLEAAQAVLDLQEGLLYVSRGAPPWLAIAREVARVLSGRQPSGGMVLALKEVLEAESAAAAREMLDELGYPA